MSYLILTTAAVNYAAASSAALWTLARPNPEPDDVTRYAVPWVVHPVTGDVALILENYTQREHPDADVAGYVTNLPIPQSEKNELRATLNAARGKVVDVPRATPPTLATNMRTRQEMDADGWFPEVPL